MHSTWAKRRHTFSLFLDSFKCIRIIFRFLATYFQSSKLWWFQCAYICRESSHLLLRCMGTTQIRISITAFSRSWCKRLIIFVRMKTLLVVFNFTESCFLGQEAVHVSRTLVFLNFDSINRWKSSMNSWSSLEYLFFTFFWITHRAW